MNSAIKMAMTQGDVCIITDRHMVFIKVDANEVVIEVTDQTHFDTVAEMTLELPNETHRIGYTPGIGGM